MDVDCVLKKRKLGYTLQIALWIFHHKCFLDINDIVSNHKCIHTTMHKKKNTISKCFVIQQNCKPKKYYLFFVCHCSSACS